MRLCVPTACIGALSDRRLTDERVLSVGGMVLTVEREKHIPVPLRLPQIPGIEPISYLSNGKCLGGGLSSEVAHLSYMSLLDELCWAFGLPLT